MLNYIRECCTSIQAKDGSYMTGMMEELEQGGSGGEPINLA